MHSADKSKVSQEGPVYDPLTLNWLPVTACEVAVPLDRIERVAREGAFLVVYVKEKSATRRSRVPILPREVEDRPSSTGIDTASLQLTYEMPEETLAAIAAGLIASLGADRYCSEMAPAGAPGERIDVLTNQAYDLQLPGCLESAATDFVQQAKQALSRFSTVRPLRLPVIVCAKDNPNVFTIYGQYVGEEGT